VLISFSDICAPACHCFCGYTLTFPLPHTLPYYPGTQHPPCPLSQATTIGGGLPAPPHSHLYFGYELPVQFAHLGLSQPSVRTELPSTSTQDDSTHSINTRKHPTPTYLGQVYKRDLVVPPCSPHQRAFVYGACTGTAQLGVSLVSLVDLLFKQSRLHCFDVCLT